MVDWNSVDANGNDVMRNFQTSNRNFRKRVMDTTYNLFKEASRMRDQ